MNEELYIGFAAHETSHAVIDELTAGRPVSRVAHEYLAYVVQISTMAPAERDTMLRGMIFRHSKIRGRSLTITRSIPAHLASRPFTTPHCPIWFYPDLIDVHLRLNLGNGGGGRPRARYAARHGWPICIDTENGPLHLTPARRGLDAVEWHEKSGSS